MFIRPRNRRSSKTGISVHLQTGKSVHPDRNTQLSGLRREGHTPKEIIQQEALKDNNIVQKLISEWYSGYAEKNRKKPKQIKQQIDADIIPLLGNMALEKTQTIDIVKALDKIVSRGAPIHANRVLSTIKQAFNYGVSRGNLQHNPAANIRPRDIGGVEKPRERFLSMDEIKKVWLFLDSEQCQMAFPTKCAIKIILLTGVRTSELRLARWEEINFDESLWTIPAVHCKSGETLRVHLNSPIQSPALNTLQISNEKINAPPPPPFCLYAAVK